MSALEVAGLHLRLGQRDVLRGATLRLDRGQVGVLTGPSGSGKSALLRLGLGLRPRAAALDLRGRVAVLGQDALAMPTAQLARRAGLVFQDAALQATQPEVAAELAFRPENLGLSWREVEARVEGAARRFGLAPLLHRPVTALSGGERKRLALAAVAAAEPELLLLDEPLGGLDEAWRSRVVEDLRREAAGRSALVVEHRAAPLRALGPKVWTVEDGAVRASAVLPRPAPGGPRARGAPSPWPAVLALDVTSTAEPRALRGATFEASPGVTLLVGPNGSGKTTLLRALLGLAPAEGTLRVAGLDPRTTPLHRLARVVGYVPQRAEDLFSQASVRDEIAFGPRRLGLPAVPGVAADLGLAHLQDRHPLTLSGGEQQRLALACALAHGPKVLLLDEPTVGLDAAGLGLALKAVRRARRDVAVVLATHDLELMALADSVATMAAGRVVRQGPPPRRVEVLA